MLAGTGALDLQLFDVGLGGGAQGSQSDEEWNAVKTAFVDGWASEYAASHGDSAAEEATE